MKLRDALVGIKQFSDEQVIFARKPWAFDSEAEIGVLTEDHQVPIDMRSRGLDYFLEISVANEVLEIFGEREPTASQKCDLLIFYAENDAYPNWVYR